MSDILEEVQNHEEMSSLNKAAVLLMSLGKDQASKVLKHLNPREIQQLGSAMTEVDGVSHRDIHQVMKSFLDEIGEDALGIDPSEYAQSLMADALGEGPTWRQSERA